MSRLELPRRLPGKYRRRSEHEFSYYTKDLAKQKTGYKCFVTGEYGSPEDQLQIHHMLPIGVWFRYFRNQVPISVLTSVENAVPLRESVHNRLHEEADLAHYTQVANWLLHIAKRQPELALAGD